MQTSLQKRIKVYRISDDNEFRRDAPPILDVESAARYLGVSTNTLYDRLESLQIPHRAIGRTLVFSRDALIEWVKKTP